MGTKTKDDVVISVAVEMRYSTLKAIQARADAANRHPGRYLTGWVEGVFGEKRESRPKRKRRDRDQLPLFEQVA